MTGARGACNVAEVTQCCEGFKVGILGEGMLVASKRLKYNTLETHIQIINLKT